MKKFILFSLLLLCVPLSSFANDIIGEWQTYTEDGKNYITFKSDGSVELQYASMWGYHNVSYGKYSKSGNKVTLSLTEEVVVYEGEPGPTNDINITLEFSISFDGNNLVLTPKNLNDKTKKFLKNNYDVVPTSIKYKKI